MVRAAWSPFMATILSIFVLMTSVASLSKPPSEWVTAMETGIRNNALDSNSELLIPLYLNEPALGDGTLTAIQYAGKNGADSNVVHALIAAGADVFRPHAGTLTTAVHFAAREGNTDTLKALLLEIQAGANAGEDKIAAELAKVDEHGNTALLLAALSGWTTAANVMFALTPAREWAVMANINGNTALQVGSFFSVSSQFIEALLAEKEIRATIEHGAHLNGRTALILAVSSNKVDNVKALLAHGAATELEPIDGQEAVSAYNVAVHTANQPLQKLLRAHEKGHEEL